jgi:hypothetical protein
MNQRTVIDEGKHWIIALAFELAVIATLAYIVVARANTLPRAGAGDKACMTASANEEHASLEAFFQNPPGQDSLAQISIACSR